jgi:hypothetical protein
MGAPGPCSNTNLADYLRMNLAVERGAHNHENANDECREVGSKKIYSHIDPAFCDASGNRFGARGSRGRLRK